MVGKRWFRHFKRDDFDVADKKSGKPPKSYESVKFQVLFDGNESQTQKQLAEQLSVSQQVASKNLRKMKIQKHDKRAPHELNDGEVEAENHLRNFVRTLQKKSFLH